MNDNMYINICMCTCMVSLLSLLYIIISLEGQETVANSETVKRQRRWNSDGLKGVETPTAAISPCTTPRDVFQSASKRDFSRSDSTASDETPKERAGKSLSYFSMILQF